MMKYTVKISNLSFDMELIPSVHEIPVIIDPKPDPPIVNEVFDFDLYLKNLSAGVHYLPKEFDGKEIVIKSKGKQKALNPVVIVGRNTIFTFESWDLSPIQLIDCKGSADISFVGITFVCPENRPLNLGAERQIFGWERNRDQKGTFAYINGQEIKDKERVTYGLARLVYSSESSENIYLIAKNIWHNGFNFIQAKNPYKGNLYTALINVTQHNPIVEDPQSHYYSRCSVKVRISVKNEIASIISDNTFDQILTWAGYNKGNQRSILYFDRFVYDISESKLIDNKNLVLKNSDQTISIIKTITKNTFKSNLEAQPNDYLAGIGKITNKQIDESRVKNWVYTHDGSNPNENNYANPEGEFDAYIVYKGNALFNNGHLNENTKFPEPEITSSQGYGWSWYCEDLTGYIENFNGSGYYRNSGGDGISQGLTIINSSFEKNGPKATSGKGLNSKAKEWIEYLESL